MQIFTHFTWRDYALHGDLCRWFEVKPAWFEVVLQFVVTGCRSAELRMCLKGETSLVQH